MNRGADPRDDERDHDDHEDDGEPAAAARSRAVSPRPRLAAATGEAPTEARLGRAFERRCWMANSDGRAPPLPNRLRRNRTHRGPPGGSDWVNVSLVAEEADSSRLKEHPPTC